MLVHDIHTAAGEARTLHSSGQGFFAVFRKLPDDDKGRKQAFYPVSSLGAVVDSIKRSPDTYISQNTFSRKSRLVTAVSRLNAAWVDIDCYKMGIAASQETLDRALDMLRAAAFPLPSYVVKSGRGLYLKWIFAEALGAVNLPAWNRLQDVLVSLFAVIHSDGQSRDASRVLRLVGTTNTAAGEDGQPVHVMWSSGLVHHFDDLMHALKTVKVEELVHAGADAAKVASFDRKIKRLNGDAVGEIIRLEQAAAQDKQFRIYSARNEPVMMGRWGAQALNWKRFIDLRDLSALRGGALQGCRDLTLFWMGVFLSHSGVIDSRNFAAEMRDLASAFPGGDFKPLDDGSMSSLLSRIKQAERLRQSQSREAEAIAAEGERKPNPIYTASNETLIKIFEISPAEQQKLCTIIGGQERARREELRYPGRAERRERRIAWRLEATELAKAARAEGREPSVTAIAAKVNVHKSEVSRLLTDKLGGARRGCLPRAARAERARADAMAARELRSRVHHSPQVANPGIGTDARSVENANRTFTRQPDSGAVPIPAHSRKPGTNIFSALVRPKHRPTRQSPLGPSTTASGAVSAISAIANDQAPGVFKSSAEIAFALPGLAVGNCAVSRERTGGLRGVRISDAEKGLNSGRSFSNQISDPIAKTGLPTAGSAQNSSADAPSKRNAFAHLTRQATGRPLPVQQGARLPQAMQGSDRDADLRRRLMATIAPRPVPTFRKVSEEEAQRLLADCERQIAAQRAQREVSNEISELARQIEDCQSAVKFQERLHEFCTRTNRNVNLVARLAASIADGTQRLTRLTEQMDKTVSKL